jgi:4-phytase/acid phosphatase
MSRNYWLGLRVLAIVLVCSLPKLPTQAQTISDAGPDLKVDRVVVLMRHGVRSPDRTPAADSALQPWPTWTVRAGWLTAHGASAIGALARSDRRLYAKSGLFPTSGCPAAGTVNILSNSLERTIATAEAYASAFAPNCALTVQHKPLNESDPLFPWGATPDATFDPSVLNAALETAIGPGGFSDVKKKLRPALYQLDRILCDGHAKDCGLSSKTSVISYAANGLPPRLIGALDLGAEIAQDIILEYADGWTMRDVGWGRSDAEDINAISSLSVEPFRLLNRPPALAALLNRPVQGRILQALSTDSLSTAFTVIVAHDGNVESLAGLLDVHWAIPGIAKDFPLPGAGLILERLTDLQGHHYVRAIYRSQSLDQIRGIDQSPVSPDPFHVALSIPGCNALGMTGLCSMEQIRERLQ